MDLRGGGSARLAHGIRAMHVGSCNMWSLYVLRFGGLSCLWMFQVEGVAYEKNSW